MLVRTVYFCRCTMTLKCDRAPAPRAALESFVESNAIRRMLKALADAEVHD